MNTLQKPILHAAAVHGAQERIVPRDAITNDLIRAFPNEDACLEFIKERRWPDGIAPCAKCGVDRKHHRVAGRKAYACDRCGTHLYPLRQTVFTRSSTPLLKWFRVIWLLASPKRQITAKRIQQEIGVTYKTAWRMLHLLRAAATPRELPALRLLEIVLDCPAVAKGRSASAPASNTQQRHARHGS